MRSNGSGNVGGVVGYYQMDTSGANDTTIADDENTGLVTAENLSSDGGVGGLLGKFQGYHGPSMA